MKRREVIIDEHEAAGWIRDGLTGGVQIDAYGNTNLIGIGRPYGVPIKGTTEWTENCAN